MPPDPAPGRAPRRWRVEELARRGDVSVDTVRFYQKRRLLPAPRREGRVAYYGEEHLERLGRIRDLRAEGLTLALIGRVLDGELDAADRPLAAAVAAADGGAEERFLTLDELATESGVPRALLEALAREGLLVARSHVEGPRFTPADVAVVRAGLALVEAGLPLPELLALARRHHRLTRDIAEEAVQLFDDHIRTPLRRAPLADAERAEQLVVAFRALLPAVTTVVAHHFRRVLLAVAQEHLEAVGEAAEVDAVQIEARRRFEAVWPA